MIDGIIIIVYFFIIFLKHTQELLSFFLLLKCFSSAFLPLVLSSKSPDASYYHLLITNRLCRFREADYCLSSLRRRLKVEATPLLKERHSPSLSPPHRILALISYICINWNKKWNPSLSLIDGKREWSTYFKEMFYLLQAGRICM